MRTAWLSVLIILPKLLMLDVGFMGAREPMELLMGKFCWGWPAAACCCWPMTMLVVSVGACCCCCWGWALVE